MRVLDIPDDLSKRLCAWHAGGFAFKSSSYVQPTDGPGVREVKEMLLARRDKFMRDHLEAFILIVAGAMVGAFFGALSKLLIGA